MENSAINFRDFVSPQSAGLFARKWDTVLPQKSLSCLDPLGSKKDVGEWLCVDFRDQLQFFGFITQSFHEPFWGKTNISISMDEV